MLESVTNKNMSSVEAESLNVRIVELAFADCRHRRYHNHREDKIGSLRGHGRTGEIRRRNRCNSTKC